MNQQQSRKHVLQHTDGKADITRDDENDASEGPKDATEGPNFSDGSGAGEQSDKHVKEEDSPKEKAEQSKVCLPYQEYYSGTFQNGHPKSGRLVAVSGFFIPQMSSIRRPPL